MEKELIKKCIYKSLSRAHADYMYDEDLEKIILDVFSDCQNNVLNELVSVKKMLFDSENKDDIIAGEIIGIERAINIIRKEFGCDGCQRNQNEQSDGNKGD